MFILQKKMTMLNSEWLHLFLKEKIYVTEKFDLSAQISTDLGAQEQVVVHKNAPEIQAGGFVKKILVVVNSKETDILIQQADYDLLLRMMNARKLSLQDLQIINIFSEKKTFIELKESYQPNIFLFFGNIDEHFFGSVETFPYFMQIIAQSLLITADTLAEIATSVEKKKRLWQTLQLVPFENF
jgi:hypothetical protein